MSAKAAVRREIIEDYILIVEDDARIRECLEQLLEFEGFSSVAVSNGAEAIEFLRHSPPPRMILLDWMMPRMSGAEFRAAQLADKQLAEIPVIVLSAGDDRIFGREPGLRGFLRKPFDVELLLKTIQ